MLAKDGTSMELIFKINNKIYKKVKEYGKLVMFSHTIFSLSFAVISILLASNGLPKFSVLFWIFVCFMGARTGANAINRVIDAEIDAKNPRTANRQIPKGEVKKKEVIIFAAICFLVMLIGTYKLNFVCLALSPVALFLLIIYSYTKRFTFLCHLVLGVTSACAPVGAWIAVRGEISLVPLVMGAANTLWVAGFDIIYGSQDYDFDKKNKLHSMATQFGVRGALIIAKSFHVITLICLLILGILSAELGFLYFFGLLIIAVLFIIEYKLISPTNLANANIASYNINQIISITLLFFGIMDALI